MFTPSATTPVYFKNSLIPEIKVNSQHISGWTRVLTWISNAPNNQPIYWSSRLWGISGRRELTETVQNSRVIFNTSRWFYPFNKTNGSIVENHRESCQVRITVAVSEMMKFESVVLSWTIRIYRTKSKLI